MKPIPQGPAKGKAGPAGMFSVDEEDEDTFMPPPKAGGMF